LILRQEGKTIYDEGTPRLASDSWSSDADEEQLVLGLIPEITGFSFERLESTEFTLFEFDTDFIAVVHSD
jgi:hypothetical protein